MIRRQGRGANRLTVRGAVFDVVLRKSGRTITVAETETLVDALRRSGVNAPSFCMSGICGTCEVRVLSGDVDHRDNYLSQSERADRMAACVSRGTSTLEIDR